MKGLLCVVLFLILAILCKGNAHYKDSIYNAIYDSHLSFSTFSKFYNQYLGGIFPIDSSVTQDSSYVFHEELIYDNLISYEEGVALEVQANYLVPIASDGIVVYVGEKNKYGNVVIIEDKEGIDTWYGNLCNINVKLYDSVKAGSYLGEVCDNTLYLVYSKGNQFLDYHDYLG